MTNNASAGAPVQNDGAIVVVLLLMMLTLATEMVFAVVLYVTQQTRISRLICGWANFGNAVVHLFLTVLLAVDTKRFLEAGISDAENLAGPLGLMFINISIGLWTLRSQAVKPHVPFGWNLFVAMAGSLVPIVWPKFVDVGLSTWPYLIVVLWFGIFAFESLAFFASCAWFALSYSEKVAGNDGDKKSD